MQDMFEDFEDFHPEQKHQNTHFEKLQQFKVQAKQLDTDPDVWIDGMHSFWGFDPSECSEIINDLCATLEESRVESLRVAVEMIARDPVFDFLTRNRCADALGNLFYNYEILDEYMYDPKDDINFTVFVDQLNMMIGIPDFEDAQLEGMIEWLFDTPAVHWSSKYKLYKNLVQTRLKNMGMIQRLGKTLISKNTLCNFSVLCLQLTRFDDNFLRTVLQRTKQHRDVKVKADVYDQLLNFESVKKQALLELKALGEGLKTLDSSQNVHMVNADVEGWLQWLSQFTTSSNTFSQVVAEFKEASSAFAQAEISPQVDYAIKRIELDNNLYGKLHLKLQTIFVKVWKAISVSEDNCEELVRRLYQELIEMSETCSSGHLLRLMNVFSGFGYNAITVDAEVELKSVINKRVELYMNSLIGQYEQTKANKGKFKFAKRLDEDEQQKGWSFTSSVDDFEGEIEDENEEKYCAEPSEQSDDLYDTVMDAWMTGKEDILQRHFYSALAKIHDEVYEDYVGQKIMTEQQFSETYRDIVNNLFVLNQTKI
jgi:hypothetical protein